jgi:hypothetical protein
MIDIAKVAIEENNAKAFTDDSFLMKKVIIPVTKGIHSSSSGKV